MKRILLLLGVLAALSSRLPAQESFNIVDRGPHHRLWNHVTLVTNELQEVSSVTNSYVEMATGLHFWQSNTWTDAQEQIIPAPGGATAWKGQHKVSFAANINTAGAIVMQTPRGTNLHSHVLGLSYFDVATSNSVLIAEIQDSIGQIVNGNQIIYTNCFDGVYGAIRYTYTKAGFEQDVLLLENPPSPSAFGMNPETTRLEVLTEFLNAAPPGKQKRILRAARGNIHNDKEFSDELLDFDSMRMAEGRAFHTGNKELGAATGKSWELFQGNREILVEQVEYFAVQNELQTLPVFASRPLGHRAMAARELPGPKVAKTSPGPIQIARAYEEPPAFVLDYVTLNSSQSNYRFSANNTYYISGSLVIDAPLFDGGTVLKYASGASIEITSQGDFQTGPYRPLILTSKNDDSVGQTISDSTHNALAGGDLFANPALKFSGNVGALTNIGNIRILFAQKGIHLTAGASVVWLNFSDLQMIRCATGIYSAGRGFNLGNSLFERVDTVLSGSAAFECFGAHVTLDTISTALISGSGASLRLTNSILADVPTLNLSGATIGGDYNGFFKTGGNPPVFGGNQKPSQTTPFVFSQAGAHYLNATFRNAGLASGVLPDTQGNIKKRTTFAPSILPASISSATVLKPIVERDTELPDLGYHYAPIDWVADQVQITGALTLDKGVAVAGWKNGNGLIFMAATAFKSDGTAMNMNVLTRLNTVQESPTNYATSSLLKVYASYPTGISFRFGFTKIPFVAGSSCILINNPSFTINAFSMKDCQLTCASVILATASNPYPLTVGLTNNAFDGCIVTLKRDYPGDTATFNLGIFNNLFLFGNFTVSYSGSYGDPHWKIFQNMFDTVSLTQTQPYGNYMDHATNAYFKASSSDTLLPIPAGDTLILSSSAFPFTTGALGRFYQGGTTPNMGGVVSGKGFLSRAESGLTHYTTLTNQSVPSGAAKLTTKADIGFHYVTLKDDLSGAVDSDGDGVEDYIEDKNGNGVADNGETDLARADTDFDGRTDGQELADGTSPLDGAKFSGKTRLASWNFEINSPAFSGDQNQLSVNSSGAVSVDTFMGKGANLNNGAGTVRLSYHYVESNGKPNVNGQVGTIRFWFKPAWSTGSSGGPGGTGIARLVQVGTDATTGYWYMGIIPDGSAIRLEGYVNGVTTTYLTASINWTAQQWHCIAVTYAPSGSLIHIDGVPSLPTPPATGAIVCFPPVASRAAAEFLIGSNAAGQNQAKGIFDLIETFDYPLPPQQIWREYKNILKIDSDGDLLPDVREDELGTRKDYRHSDGNPSANPPTTGDGMPDGWEVAFGFNPLQLDGSGDADGDGVSNYQEYLNKTDPWEKPISLPPKPSFETVTSPRALINIDVSILGKAPVQGSAVAGFGASDYWNAITGSDIENSLDQALPLLDAAQGKTGVTIDFKSTPFKIVPVLHLDHPVVIWPPPGSDPSDEPSQRIEIDFDTYRACSLLYSPNSPGYLRNMYCCLSEVLEGAGLPNCWWSCDNPGDPPITRDLEIRSRACGVPMGFDWLPNHGMYLDYLTFGMNVSATISGLAEGAYVIYAYAHGAASENIGVIDFNGVRYVTQKAEGWNTSKWRKDVQYVRIPFEVRKGSEKVELLIHAYTSINGFQIARLDPPAAPVVTGSAGRESAYLTWNPVMGANAYTIYRSNSPTSFLKIADSTACGFKDTGLSSGPSDNYHYYVVAKNDKFGGPPSNIVMVHPLDKIHNSSPLLSSMEVLGPAVKNDSTLQSSVPYRISYGKLLASSDAEDDEKDAISFLVTSVQDGTLKLFTPGQTPASYVLPNASAPAIGPNDYLEWTPPVDYVGTSPAFEVKAFDGNSLSWFSVPCFVEIKRPTALYGWGLDLNGILGNGDEFFFGRYGNNYSSSFVAHRADPSPVTGMNNVKAMYAFWYGPNAAVQNDSRVSAWGEYVGVNPFGDGPDPFSSTWVYPFFKVPTVVQRKIGTSVSPLENIESINFGAEMALAVGTDGSVWTWGAYDAETPWFPQPPQGPLSEGGIGTGSPVQIPGLSKIVSVLGASDSTAGAGDSSLQRYGMALDRDGVVWWWGFLSFISPGATRNDDHVTRVSFTPAPYDWQYPQPLTGFFPNPIRQIAGTSRSFIALDKLGQVYEFGYQVRLAKNFFFNLDKYQATPTLVPELPPAKKIAAGGGYFLALLEDGTVRAWGILGASKWISEKPVVVPHLEEIVEITVANGGEGAMAIDKSGRVWVWGDNSDGQVDAYETTEFIGIPRRLSAIEGATLVASGGPASFAVAVIPERPVNLRGIAGNGEARLTWSPMLNATWYVVKRAEGDSANFVPVATVKSPKFTDRGLINHRLYRYAVAAMAAGNETANSDYISLIPEPAPVPPASLVVTPGCHSAVLDWEVDPVVQEYKIFRSENSQVTYAGSSQTASFVDEDLVSDHTYTWYVVASNPGGDSSPSASVSATIDSSTCPPTPAWLGLPSVGDNSVTLNWGAVAGASAYRLNRYNEKGHLEMPDLRASGTSFTQENIQNGRLYGFTVSTVVMVGTGVNQREVFSEESAMAWARPSCDCVLTPPANFQVFPGNTQVYLRWDEDPKARYFTVQYKTVNGSTWITPAGGSEVSENYFWIPGLVNHTAYQFKVIAKNPSHEAETSAVTATPEASYTGGAPSTADPFALTVHAYDKMVVLTWPTTSPNYRYFVERKTGGEAWRVVSETDYKQRFSDVDVKNGVGYTYRVTALDQHYNRYLSEEAWNVTPVKGSGLVVIPSPGNTYIDLAWNDLGSEFVYQVKHSLQKGGPYDNLLDRSTDTSFHHGALANNIPHYYVVVAVDALGMEHASPELSVTPLSTLAPPVPTGLRVTPANTAAILSWDRTAGALSYRVQRKVGEAGTYLDLFSGSALGCQDSAPSTTDTTFYQVRAEAGAGVVSEWLETSIVFDPSLANTLGAVSILGITQDASLVTPTNLLLRTTVTMPNLQAVEFYTNGVLMERVDAPPYQAVWKNVPATSGTDRNTVQARAVDSFQDALASPTISFSVAWVSELSPFQTAATDLQLPAPGLPLTIGRGYDSRRAVGPASSPLGLGWVADWDQARVAIEAPLSDGWAAADPDKFSRYMARETVSHLITVTLPSGETAYFSPFINIPFQGDPLKYPLANLSIEFAPLPGTFGTLECPTARNWDVQNLEPLKDWSEHPTLRVADEDNFAFEPQEFTYVTPDGLRYRFLASNGWKLDSITDRHKNSLTYVYAANQLTEIRHSCGRSIHFATTVNNGNGEISVYDPIEWALGSGKMASVKYTLANSKLTQVSRLRGHSSSPAYDTTVYEYGTTGGANNRIVSVTDPRSVKVLELVYDTAGLVTEQKDAAGRSTLVAPNSGDKSVAMTRSVNGANETETALHDASGQITGVTTAAGTTSLVYDEKGRLIEQIDTAQKKKSFTYDGQDRLVKQEDPLGNSTSTSYNFDGTPSSATDANGNLSQFEYDTEGNLIWSIDAAGNLTTFEYTPYTPVTAPFVQLKKESKKLSGTSTILSTTYDYYGPNDANGSLGDLKSVTDSMGNVTTYTYDQNGNRLKETRLGTVNGQLNQSIVTESTYDSQNRVVSTKDPELRSSTVTLDEAGRQTKTVDVYGRETWFAYDSLGNLIQTIYSDGSVSRTAYDERNRPRFTQDRVKLSSMTVANATTDTTAAATETVYDAAGRVVLTIRWKIATFSKGTQAGQPAMSAAPSGNPVPAPVYTSRSQYDSAGRLKYSVSGFGTSGNGIVTEYVYDDAGRRTAVRQYPNYEVTPMNSGTISPTGTVIETSTGYDNNGNQIYAVDANNHRTDFVYDALNRRIRTVHALVSGEATRKESRTVYDSLGRRVLEVDEAGVMTGFGYDVLGRLISVTNDFKIGVTGSAAMVTEYGYDPQGNMISQRDALSRETKYQYDKLGRRTKRTIPGPASTANEVTAYTTTADPSDSSISLQRKSVTDFRGATITYDFDRLERLKTKVLPAVDTTPGATINYAYNALGKLVSVFEPGRTTNLRYDSLARLWVKDTPEGVVVYNYDGGDRLRSIDGYRRSAVAVNVVPSGFAGDASMNYTYDRLGRLQTVTDTQLGGGSVTTYTYDGAGNLGSAAYPSGLKHAYTYTEQNRLKNLTITKNVGATATLLRSYDYTLGMTGNRTEVLEKYHPATTDAQRRRVKYEYDVDHSSAGAGVPRLYRLTQESLFSDLDVAVGTIGNVYDRVGNRTQRMVANLPSAYEAIIDQTRNFDTRDLIDPNSDQTDANPSYDANGNTKVDSDGTVTGDKYDAENRLVQRGSVSIVYDYGGNRVSKTINGITTTYLVDDQNPTGYSQVLAEFTFGEPLNTSLMGLWKLDETSNLTASDSSGQGRNGTLVNGPSWNLGQVNNGLFFDGVDDQVTVTSVNGLKLGSAGNAAPFSIAFWTRKDQETTSPVRWVGKGASGVENYGVWEDSTTHKAQFKFNTSGGTTTLTGTTTLSVGRCYHIACTYDGTTAKLYVDGKLEQSASSGAPVSSDDALTFGYAGWSGAHKGLLDEIHLYAKTLSINEIRALARTPKITYLYGNDLIRMREESSGAVSYYGYDGQGSVRQLFNASQVETDRYDYDASGMLLSAVETTSLNNYRYTGEQWDPDLGMYYLRARYYRPNDGRFWTMDGYEGNRTDSLSLHKYLYCRSDPGNRIDPSGHTDMVSVLCAAGITLALSASYVNAPGFGDRTYSDDGGMFLVGNIMIGQAISLGIRYIAAPLVGKLITVFKPKTSVPMEVVVEVPTFRGETCSVENAETKIADAFGKGLEPRGGASTPPSWSNLLESINKGSKNSAHVQSSESADIAVGFATGGGGKAGVVYEVLPRTGSVVVNNSPIADGIEHAAQKIVAHPGGIKPQQIIRAHVIDKKGNIVKTMENPNLTE
jgi:RHS repeat-associated protein